MKIRIALSFIILVLISKASISQIFNPSLYSYPTNSIGLGNICRLSNGILVSGGRNIGPGSTSNAFIAKYDFNGNNIWTKEYLDSTILGAFNILELPNEEIAAIFWHQTTGPVYFSYLHLDSTGDILSNKIYYQPESSRIYRTILTPDSNLLMVGQIDSAGPWQPAQICLKMDLSGNIIWCHTLGYYNPDISCDLNLLQDGTFIVYQPGNGPNLWRMDAHGNLLWYWEYGLHYIAANHGLCTDSLKNSYAIATDDSNRVVLFKVDSSGIFQWAHAYGPFNQYKWCEKFLYKENNFYLILTDSKDFGFDSTSHTSILKIDSQGNLIKSTTFKLPTNFAFSSPSLLDTLSPSKLVAGINVHDSLTGLTSYIITELDTSLSGSCLFDTVLLHDVILTTTSTIISTSVDSFSLSDSLRFIYSINQVHNLSNLCLSSGIIEQDIEVAVITNPIVDLVSFKSDEIDILNIEIYSSSGKLVTTWSGRTNFVTLPMSQFMTGLYFARINTIRGSYSKKLIKF